MNAFNDGTLQQSILHNIEIQAWSPWGNGLFDIVSEKHERILEKAKEIHKDHIRNVRNPLLQAKDVEYMRAQEAGDTEKSAAVVAEKQALRDATKLVDNVEITGTSVEDVTAELKQVWDEELLGPNPLV